MVGEIRISDIMRVPLKRYNIMIHLRILYETMSTFNFPIRKNIDLLSNDKKYSVSYNVGLILYDEVRKSLINSTVVGNETNTSDLG